MAKFYRLTQKLLNQSSNPSIKQILHDSNFLIAKSQVDEPNKNITDFIRENVKTRDVFIAGVQVRDIISDKDNGWLEAKWEREYQEQPEHASAQFDIKKFLINFFTEKKWRVDNVELLLQHYGQNIADGRLNDVFMSQYINRIPAFKYSTTNIIERNNCLYAVSKLTDLKLRNPDETLSGDIYVISKLTQKGFKLQEFQTNSIELLGALMSDELNDSECYPDLVRDIPYHDDEIDFIAAVDDVEIVQCSDLINRYNNFKFTGTRPYTNKIVQLIQDTAYHINASNSGDKTELIRGYQSIYELLYNQKSADSRAIDEMKELIVSKGAVGPMSQILLCLTAYESHDFSKERNRELEAIFNEDMTSAQKRKELVELLFRMKQSEEITNDTIKESIESLNDQLNEIKVNYKNAESPLPGLESLSIKGNFDQLLWEHPESVKKMTRTFERYREYKRHPSDPNLLKLVDRENIKSSQSHLGKKIGAAICLSLAALTLFTAGAGLVALAAGVPLFGILEGLVALEAAVEVAAAATGVAITAAAGLGLSAAGFTLFGRARQSTQSQAKSMQDRIAEHQVIHDVNEVKKLLPGRGM